MDKNFDDIKENLKGFIAKSRSNSKERKKSEIAENVSQFFNNDDINDNNDSPLLNPQPIEHKLGKLLFSIIKNPSNKDIDAFCANFDEYLTLSDTHQKASNTLLKQELKHEFSEQIFKNNTTNPDLVNEVIIPRFFGDESIAQNEKKQNLLRHLLPSEKFGGGNGIIQFLDCMTHAQEILNMSEKEFQYHFIRMTSGPVYEYLRTSFLNGNSIEDAYRYLLSVYHKPLESNVALKLLTNFKADRSMTFPKLHSKILSLATAASKISPLHTRQSFINIYASTFLIQSLPPISSQKANNTYQLLLSQKANVTYLDLVNSLSKFSDSINKDIFSNGIQPSENRKRFNVNTLKKYDNTQKNAYIKKKDYTPQNSKPSNKPVYNDKYKNNFRQQYPRQASNIKRSIPQEDKVPRKKFKVNNVSQKYMQKPQSTYCVLCGYNNHAAPNCLNMIDDSSKRHDIPPSFSYCQKCFQQTSKKLFHPPKFCVNRPKYLEIKKNLKQNKSQ